MNMHWTNKDMEKLYEIICNIDSKCVDYMQNLVSGDFVKCKDENFFDEFDLSSPLQAMNVLDDYLNSDWDKEILKTITVCLFRNEDTTKRLESRIPDYIYNF